MLNTLRTVLRRPNRQSGAAHLDLGAHGERMALEYLRDYEDYRIVATNFLVPLGRGLRGQKVTGEIDIIAYDGATLVFVEVKARTSDELATPERAVGLRKQRQIVRAASRYRQLMKVYDEPYRYDVVTVLPNAGATRIELLRGYFDDRVFQRSRYLRADA